MVGHPPPGAIAPGMHKATRVAAKAQAAKELARSKYGLSLHGMPALVTLTPCSPSRTFVGKAGRLFGRGRGNKTTVKSIKQAALAEKKAKRAATFTAGDGESKKLKTKKKSVLRFFSFRKKKTG